MANTVIAIDINKKKQIWDQFENIGHSDMMIHVHIESSKTYLSVRLQFSRPNGVVVIVIHKKK